MEKTNNYREILEQCISHTMDKIEKTGHDLTEAGRTLDHIFCWTQGFVTGMAGIAYQMESNEEALRWLYSVYDLFYDKVHKYSAETMHDLGFLYSPYAVMMYKLTNDLNMKELGVAAADCLVKRYVPNGHYIRAWGRMDGRIPEYVDSKLAKDHFFTESENLAIVDCMMNLPLLFWASEVTQQPIYSRIAVEHIETTLKCFVRDDDTVCHAFRFCEDGRPMKVENYCGFGKESVWARGTTWIIYGLAIAYRYTGIQKYQQMSVRLFEKFISLCQGDAVPVWDFRLPAESPAKACAVACDWDEGDLKCLDNARDTSAAAIAVCAAQELLQHMEHPDIAAYKERALTELCEKYVNVCEGGILSHSNGRMEYTWFGDYYFMQALATETGKIVNVW